MESENFNLKKGLLAGVTYYIPTFISGMIAMTLYQPAMAYVWWIASIIFMYLGVKKVYKATSEDGFKLGVLFLVITFAVEIPLFVFGLGFGWGLYSMWTVWIQYALVLLTPVVVAKLE